VNGVCSATVNACSVGSFADQTDSATQYLWQCVGSNGGTTASCSATIPVVSVPDTTLPAVSITSPLNGTTISNTVTLSASASDNVGVVGVQFKLDGANLGSELTTAPYSGSWNTNGVSNGSHTLTAVARDAAGNTRTSSPVTITVANTAPSAPTTPTSPSLPTGSFTPTVPQVAPRSTVPVTSCTTPSSSTATSTYAFKETLSIGKSHIEVKTLQQLLNSNGYTVALSGPGSKGSETATFGPATERAVKALQSKYKITPTGTVGSITRLVLSTLPFKVTTLSNCAPTTTKPVSLTGKYVFTLPLDIGAKNEDVRQLQIFLSSLPNIYPEKLITGTYGPLTQAAVKRFQLQYNLTTPTSPAYGFVGPGTRAKLNSLVK
jgi:peptidoglycan hydrolase-like protein with peptidoglycan-binding domain